MYRSNTCGELRLSDAEKVVTLSGWVDIARDLGKFVFLPIKSQLKIKNEVIELSKHENKLLIYVFKVILWG